MTYTNGISIHELSGKSSLLTRGTADEVLDRFASSQLDPGSPIIIDFGNVKGVTPSFLHQLIGGLRLKYSTSATPLSLWLQQMPTPASEKFFAVGRSHNMVLNEASAGEWHFTESRA